MHHGGTRYDIADSSLSLPERRCAIGEPGRFLRRAVTAEDAVAVRETTEAHHDVAMLAGIVGIVLQQGTVVAFDALVRSTPSQW